MRANRRNYPINSYALAEIVIVNEMPPVINDNDDDNGDHALHKRLDPVTDKCICNGELGDWNGLARNTFGVPTHCAENDGNTVEDWKPSARSRIPRVVESIN